MRSYGLDLVQISEKIPISEVPVEITPTTEGDAIGGFDDQQFLLSTTRYLAAEILADTRLRQLVHAFRCRVGTLWIDHGEMPPVDPAFDDPNAIVLVKHGKYPLIIIPLRTDNTQNLDKSDKEIAFGRFETALQCSVYTRAEMLSVVSKLLRCANVVGARYAALRAARQQIRTLFHDLRNCLTTTLAEMSLLKRVGETRRVEYEQTVTTHLQTAANLLGKLEHALAKPSQQKAQTDRSQNGFALPPQLVSSAQNNATHPPTKPQAQDKTDSTQTKIHTYRAAELVCRAACWAIATAETCHQNYAKRLKVRTATKGYEHLNLALEPTDLDCIIQNIVKNGVEAACANTSPEQAPFLEIIIENTGLHCFLIVRDSGRGFSPEYLAAQKDNALGTTRYSTKPDRHPETTEPDGVENHGYGLLSVRQKLERVGGHLSYKRTFSTAYDGEVSEVEIYIPQVTPQTRDYTHKQEKRRALTLPEAGVSLVELLVVLAILAAVVTIGITYVRGSRSVANTRAAAEVLRNAILMRARDARRFRAGAPPDAFNQLGTPRLELRVDQPQTWGLITQATPQGATWNYTVSPSAAVNLPSGWRSGSLNCLSAIGSVGPPPVANPTTVNRIVFDFQGNLYDPTQPDSTNATLVAYVCAGQSSLIAATATQGANAQAVQVWYVDTSSTPTTWTPFK